MTESTSLSLEELILRIFSTSSVTPILCFPLTLWVKLPANWPLDMYATAEIGLWLTPILKVK